MATAWRRRESERDFQRCVLEAAQALGWRCYHQRPAWTTHGYRTALEGDAGWPDLVCCRDRPQPRLLIAELKTGRNRLTPAQAQWLALLRQVPGIEVYEWRPEAWEDIVKTLRAVHPGVD